MRKGEIGGIEMKNNIFSESSVKYEVEVIKIGNIQQKIVINDECEGWEGNANFMLIFINLKKGKN